MQIAHNGQLTEELAKELNRFFDVPHPELCKKKLQEFLEGKQSKSAVIQIHLEDFKSFNDTFGYEFGGLFIKKIARFLCSIPKADVYRIAGVEFVIILENCSRANVESVLNHIVDRFDCSWQLKGMDCMSAINIGVLYFPYQAESVAEVLENLNDAVSESAVLGQNVVVAYNEDLKQKILRKKMIARRIPEALKDGSVEIRYRPTYNVPLKRFTRADCYMRMYCEDFGIIQASEFIPIAEQSGQIGIVGRYAIEKTSEMIADLLAANKDFETIAVPISPIQFLQEHFVEEVEQIIQKTGIPASSLAFEVTEHFALNAFSTAQANLQEISDMGIEIVLTEFGTGQSGLSNVLSMPIDAVKLERLLIWQLDNNPRGAHLIEGLIHIAHNLGIKLIAEGVETETQVESLEKFGCEYEQGFYYSPTLTADDLKGFFNDKQ